METKVQKYIIDYFSCVEEFFNLSKTCLKICQNCAITINKVIQRCKHVKEAEIIGTPLDEFLGLQSKILTCLHNLISVEVFEIRNQLSNLEELFEKLCHKHKLLHEGCRDIEFTSQSALVKGTPLQPPLIQLLDFASDSFTFCSQICAQIETSLQVLSFKGLNTDHFIDNFKFPSNWNKKITEIIAYTSFCSENKI